MNASEFHARCLCSSPPLDFVTTWLASTADTARQTPALAFDLVRKRFYDLL